MTELVHHFFNLVVGYVLKTAAFGIDYGKWLDGEWLLVGSAGLENGASIGMLDIVL
jgi:hypothetical protein